MLRKVKYSSVPGSSEETIFHFSKLGNYASLRMKFCGELANKV